MSHDDTINMFTGRVFKMDGSLCAVFQRSSNADLWYADSRRIWSGIKMLEKSSGSEERKVLQMAEFQKALTAIEAASATHSP